MNTMNNQKTIAAILCIAAAMVSAATHQDISDDTLYQWIHGGAGFAFLLIDVRDSVELDTTAVIGSDTCRPYNLSSRQDTLRHRMAGLPHDACYVLYCRTGVRSNAAANMLDSNGFTHVYDKTGSFNGWRASGKATLPRAKVKPRSLLPEPSMPAPSTGPAALPVRKISGVGGSRARIVALPARALRAADLRGYAVSGEIAGAGHAAGMRVEPDR
jgi:rhodanese-related sulfurtransferase